MSKCNSLFKTALVSKHGNEQTAVQMVCNSIKHMALACRCVFAVSFPRGSDEAVQNAVQQAKASMKSCWTDVRGITFKFVSNFHAANHASQLINWYGSIRLCSCARGEGKNCFLRRVSGRCNHTRPEYDMLMAQNIGWAIKYMLAGGWVHIYNYPSYYSPSFLDVLRRKDPVLLKLLEKATAGDSYVGHHEPETLSMTDTNNIGVLRNAQRLQPDQTTAYFQHATIPNREKSLSQVQVGGFFTCVDPESNEERVGLVRSITASLSDVAESIDHNSKAKEYRLDFGKVEVEVTWMHVTNALHPSELNMLTLPDPNDAAMHAHGLPILCVCSPIHAVPRCEGGAGSSTCAIATAPDQKRPAGCYGFCVGLNHGDGSTNNRGRFVVNKYLAK